MAVSIPTKPTWIKDLNHDQIKRVQRQLNEFGRKRLLGRTPLIVDGKNGDHTRAYIKLYKYYLGWSGERNTQVTRRFMRQLEHPNWPMYSTPARIARGVTRRRKQRRLWREHQAYLKNHPHVETYDGKAVAAYFVPILNWARHTGHNGLKWRGSLVSGYRTPAYSESLCYHMCGRPSCPGLCAGRSTNHAGLNPNSSPHGAVDVSDYERFGYLMQFCPIRPRVFNALPRDRVHFSPTGN